MFKLWIFLLMLAFAMSCNDRSNEEPEPISAPERDWEKADQYFPLALGNIWEYAIDDSTNMGIETSYRTEKVDSCCYYIGVYDQQSGQYKGWKWRDFSRETMYSNGGSTFFTTKYIDKEKGKWYRLDSTISQNIIVVDVASGTYDVTTPAGTFTCIKTKTQLIDIDKRYRVVHTRYFGKGVGLVKHIQRFWETNERDNAVLTQTIVQTLQ